MCTDMYWALSKGDLCWQDALSLRLLPSKIHLALFSHLKLYMEKVSYARDTPRFIVTWCSFICRPDISRLHIIEHLNVSISHDYRLLTFNLQVLVHDYITGS